MLEAICSGNIPSQMRYSADLTAIWAKHNFVNEALLRIL